MIIKFLLTFGLTLVLALITYFEEFIYTKWYDSFKPYRKWIIQICLVGIYCSLIAMIWSYIQ